jgi:hypothetical protein
MLLYLQFLKGESEVIDLRTFLFSVETIDSAVHFPLNSAFWHSQLLICFAFIFIQIRMLSNNST